MSGKTSIEWTDATWNPTSGCDRVSPGCDNCYALTLAKRLKAIGSPRYQRDGDPRTSGPGFGLTEHPDALNWPLRKTKPLRIFVNSMSDIFHKDVEERFIGDVWDVMAKTPQHTYQILTKRPQRMCSVMQAWAADRWHWRRSDMHWCQLVDDRPLSNVWLGTSIEEDKFCFRADYLRRTPAVVRFLSLEPLLGPLPSLDLTGINWVIVGGESGPNARPMHPDWVRDIRDKCISAGVKFFFKQWGEWSESEFVGYQGQVCLDGSWSTTDNPRPVTSGNVYIRKVGKRKAGRTLDGRTWDEMP
jgi:protein gp37